MGRRHVLTWSGIAVAGGLSLVGAWMFVEHPYYSLMLIHPLVLAVFHLAFNGGGLAFLVGLGMAVREITRR